MTSPHGTRARYVAGCGCTSCTTANSRSVKLYKHRAHLAGGSTTVPVEASQQQLKALTEHMSISAAAKLTGLSHRHASRIINGEHKRVSIAVHNRIMGADPDGDPGRHKVSARGARRRLQSLVAIGWSYTKLGDELLDGYGRSNVAQIIDGRREFIRGDIDRRIRRLWDELCMTPYTPQDRIGKGHATRARAIAKRNGWAPPLAWDDIDRDDEPQMPEGPGKGDRTLENYEWLTSNGYSRDQALEKLGITYEAITTGRRRRAEKNDEAA